MITGDSGFYSVDIGQGRLISCNVRSSSSPVIGGILAPCQASEDAGRGSSE